MSKKKNKISHEAREIISFLKWLAQQTYPDEPSYSHYAEYSKGHKFHYGYTNDKEIQHGSGDNNILSYEGAQFLMKSFESQYKKSN